MTILNIVPECYVDTKVAEIPGQAKKYNHQHGCGDVANELKTKLHNKIALGIIDEDKNKGPASKYFSEFNILETKNHLILKKHKERKHYLIVICPEIENWLLTNATRVEIIPADYGLVNNLQGLKQLSKIQSIDKNIGFYRFIKKLLRKKAPGITVLKNWIELFNTDKLH